MIYFIQQGTSGPIKIGYTENNVNERIKSLQTGNPTPLKLIGYIPGTVEDEKAIHKMFENFNIQNEWFQPVIQVINYIIEYSLKGTDTHDVRVNLNLFDLKAHLHHIERKIIIDTLTAFHGNKSRTAKHLNIARPTLIQKIKSYNLFLHEKNI